MRNIRVCAKDYVRYITGLNYSPKTIKVNSYRLHTFISWLEQREILTPENISFRHLMLWQESLSQRTNNLGHPLRANSINRQISVARCFLEYLYKKGVISKAVTEVLVKIKEPKLLPTGVLTDEQVQQIMSIINLDDPLGYRDRTMLELLYSSGLRSSEILGLNVQTSIDLKNRLATVFGKRKERVVPIGKTAAKFLETYIKCVRPTILSNFNTTSLFINSKGGPMQYCSLRAIVHKYGEKAKVEVNVTPHVFRRSCTTELLRADANPYHVSLLLGHESLDTIQHYAKLTITDLKKTHEKCHPRDKDDD